MMTMTMPTAPRRRWFQLGLATMFVVVTVFAIALGLLAQLKHSIADLKAQARERDRNG